MNITRRLYIGTKIQPIMLISALSRLILSGCQRRWPAVLTKVSYSNSKSKNGATNNKIESQDVSRLVKRPPVITIMGHVDHGKTTLIDNLRRSKIVEQEFGGITQHIGAFVVPFKLGKNKELVTFLDTPGHAAFAAMRQRGANVTDIVVLVVACDDGILDQTVESIRYAKTSEVPIIVAVNKIDKISDEKVLAKQVEDIRVQLRVHDVISEEDGGDVQLVRISALKGIGIDYLKESILALAETLDLKAELDCPVQGHVIESSLDPHRGKLCTVLVEKGSLKKGDVLMAGPGSWCRVRALFDERAQLRQECGPGLPIQVTGWRGDILPSAGDPVAQVENEAAAKALIHKFNTERAQMRAQEAANEYEKQYSEHYRIYSQKLAAKRLNERARYSRTLWEDERGRRPKELVSEDDPNESKINLVLKCDVDGSLDAILDLLDTYDKNNTRLVKLDILHHGVGAITDSDYKMASTFPNSVIYGFNVKPADQKVLLQAKKDGVPLKLFNVIYHLIDDLKARLSEKMPEIEKEVELGRANVLQGFIINDGKRKRLPVAGCKCNKGILRRENVYYRWLRNNEVIRDELVVNTLKHFKDDVKEVEKDKECGISFQEFVAPKSSSLQTAEHQQELTFRLGDVLVCYEKQRVKPELKWSLKGFD